MTANEQLPIPTATGIEGDKDQIVKDRQIFVQKEPFGFRYSFFFTARHIQNDAPLIGYLVFEHAEDSTQSPITTEVMPDIAQHLMDELWRSGLRPSDEIGYPGELQATRLHLTDTREMNKRLLDVVLREQASPKP